MSGVKELERQDGTGDYWSVVVVRLRAHGDRLQGILLYGAHSRTWSSSEGFSEIASLMKHWHTNMLFNESYGGLGADYTQEAIRACRSAGVNLYLDKVAGAYRLPKFSDSHASAAKNKRFELLTDWARREDFLVCDEVPDEFLEGEPDKLGTSDVGFYVQMRKMRPLAKGRNNLKYDDDGDAVARITDSVLPKFAPRPSLIRASEGWSPYRAKEPEYETHGSKYVQW